MTTVSQLLSKVGIDTSDVSSGLQSFNQVMVNGVGTATQQAQLRIDSLSDRITFQKRQLDLLGTSLIETARKHGDTSVQVQQQVLAYDRLSASIAQNERQLPILNQRLQEGSTFGQQFGQSFTQSINGIIGPAALATAAVGGVYAAIRTGEESVGEALALREQQNSLRAVTGDIGRYNEAIRAAKDQQLIFGGTIKDNIEGVQGLAITAKETGASLAELIDISQRLTLKSPEQGAGGSRIALVEALSEGNIRSLRQRFEIPAEALAKLKDQSLSVEERLAALSGYLDRIGLSSAAVAGRVDEDAQAFRRFNQELETSRIGFGDWLADGIGPATEGLGRLFGLINQNPKAIAELKALRIFGGTGVVNQADIDKETRNVAASQVLGEIGTARYERKTDYAGASFDVRNAQISSLDALTPRLLQAGIKSEESKQKVLQLIDAFGETGNLRAFVDGLDKIEGAGDKATKALKGAAGATKELTDEERERLENQRDQTFERAGDAFTRLKTAEADYTRESAERLSDHQRKLADIQSDGNARLADIDQRYGQQTTDLDASYLDKRADIQRDLTRKLADLEQDYTRDQAQRRQDAADRLAQIDANMNDRLIELRADSASRIAELEEAANEEAQARRDAQAERTQAAAERRSEIEQQLAQRLADFDQQQLERREAAQEQYQDRLASLAERRADQERQAQQQSASREQAYQDKLADASEAASDRAEDRAQRHADRLEDIRRRSESTQQGRITRLTGETFTTEFAGSADTGENARLAAEEEERYRIEEERAKRDEQRAQDRLERDRQRQEEQAQQRLSDQESQYQRELEQADAAYAASEAKADEKAARDRARLEQQGADQLAAFELQTARAEAQVAKQEALEDEKRERQIAKEREALSAREADAVADAEKQRARLVDDLAKDLEARDLAYQEQRAKAQASAAEQLADAESTYAAQLAKLMEAHDQQRQAAEQATADRIAAEADSYARQEEQRQAAYARQIEQLRTALGEQLQAYTDIQLKLGDITQGEADRRTKILEAEYLAQAKAQKDAFEQFFGTSVFGQQAPERDDWRLDPTVGNRSGANSPIVIQSLTVNGVQDTRALLAEIRREAISEVRANGGDVDSYWGGA